MSEVYQKTIWKDQIVDEDGNVVQEGTRFTAVKMNNIENGIGNVQNDLTLLQNYLNYMPINGGDFDGNEPGLVVDGGTY